MNIDDIRKKIADRGYVTENRFRHYSILIPLINGDDGVRVLYEVRSMKLDRQPGEICFPGGEVEEEETFADCALRETREEIGIRSEDIELMGELTTIYGAGSFAMHCYPAVVDAKAMDCLCLNAEVEEVFTVSLEDLLEARLEMYHTQIIQNGPEGFPYDRVTSGEPYPWSRFKAPVPVYDVDGRIIWGLTGRATRVLIETLKGGC